MYGQHAIHVNNRAVALRHATDHNIPFTIEREDVGVLPELLKSLPHLQIEKPKGWNLCARLPLVELSANWRTFILLGNAYAILPDGLTLGRFRRNLNPSNAVNNQ